MIRKIATHTLAALAAAALAIGGYAALQPDPYSQNDFPCAEDELLGYSPDLAPDTVGCIHIDVIDTRK